MFFFQSYDSGGENAPPHLFALEFTSVYCTDWLFMKDACPVEPEGALAPCSMPFPRFVQLSHAGCDSDAQPGEGGGADLFND